MFVHRRTGEVWPFPKGQAGSGKQTRASPTGCRLFYIHAKGTDALMDASSRTPQSWAHLPGRKHQNEGHRCESDGGKTLGFTKATDPNLAYVWTALSTNGSPVLALKEMSAAVLGDFNWHSDIHQAKVISQRPSGHGSCAKPTRLFLHFTCAIKRQKDAGNLQTLALTELKPQVTLMRSQRPELL
ncbi:hypothetical protein G5714_018783 [Onychostoma macrolepis]|uniref:Uncharacterized protein n=1 Tax=Onychostoma macrolepis TaxID=369639 RepID=A0A7J6C009_9TELE|nr:hypothetical protein G5714_018783 [Onychostoma macrolepis]